MFIPQCFTWCIQGNENQGFHMSSCIFLCSPQGHIKPRWKCLTDNHKIMTCRVKTRPANDFQWLLFLITASLRNAINGSSVSGPTLNVCSHHLLCYIGACANANMYSTYAVLRYVHIFLKEASMCHMLWSFQNWNLPSLCILCSYKSHISQATTNRAICPAGKLVKKLCKQMTKW